MQPEKSTDAVWDGLWREWQDRRNRIRSSLATLEQSHQTHIDNLDVALEMISRVGVVHNALERSDQKELLRHVVSRVVIDNEGIISLELRAPFAYLQNINDELRKGKQTQEDNLANSEKETGEVIFTGFPRTECSLTVLSCGENRIRTCDRGLPPDNRLAGGPIRPLWHLPKAIFACQWFSGGEGGIRTPGAHRSTVFKTAAINHSATSPRLAANGRCLAQTPPMAPAAHNGDWQETTADAAPWPRNRP
jgi:hypothetical protein